MTRRAVVPRAFETASLPSGAPRIRFAILISPGFGMLSYASIVDVLKQTRDYFAGRALEWRTLAAEEGPVAASNGLLVLPQGQPDMVEPFDYVVVIGSVTAARDGGSTEVESWLRRQHRHGATICGTASAAWVLARAGLLVGRRCTLHWRDHDAFSERYRNIEIVDDVYVADGRVVTCSGARIASDMTYWLLGEHFGHDAVARVQEILYHDRERTPHEHRRPLRERMAAQAPGALRLLIAIGEEIENGTTVGELCARLGLKRRNVEVGFRRHMGVSPKQYQLDLRLARAANLLNKTNLRIGEIAAATGFGSAAGFTTAFSRRYDISPNRYRREGLASVPSRPYDDIRGSTGADPYRRLQAREHPIGWSPQTEGWR